MLRNKLAVALLLCCTAGPVYGASLEKAKALYQNNLLDDAKRELIEVLYAADSESADKALSLYMLGMVNEKQGQTELAAANWKELIERFPQAPEAQLARDNLARQGATQQKNTAVQPGKPAATGAASSVVEVRQGTAADLSHSLRTEVPSPMVIQATVPAMKPGLRDRILALDIKGTDLYVCDKAHVTQLAVSRRPRPLGGDSRRPMLDEVNAWPRGAAMVYVVAPTISTEYFRQDIDLTITARTQSGEVLAMQTWDDLTIGADNAASKLGIWGASSTKSPKLVVPVTEAQVERFEAEPFLVKIVIEIQD
jgi:tetratricopeptide (TPR) repeat protein